jgi:hypothetical protein
MTTGRINQVTILSRSPREAPANRPQSGRQSSVRGGSPESDPRYRSPEPELQQVPTARSNCPHCVPQGAVRGTTARAPGAVTGCRMRPSGGGYRQLVTHEAATSLGLPPNVLRITVAIGQ